MTHRKAEVYKKCETNHSGLDSLVQVNIKIIDIIGNPLLHPEKS